ncbi:MAG TPA: carboxylesterase family protein [Sphingobium sp.]|uniref:carboxylesterase/lipase family protein n=1 Tax=Sphingobium sp. TaxID=1912891 RepID=UPI002ED653F3
MAIDRISRRAVMASGTLGGAALFMSGGLFAAETVTLTAPVATANGRVRGMRGGGISRFLGIPYGDDTSKARFQPPRPAPGWTGVRDCFAPGAQAPQGIINLPGIGSGGGITGPLPPAAGIVMAVARSTSVRDPESENCLFLNIFTPEASTTRKRPVMVWLHGGAFAMGQGLNPMTDGTALARDGDLVMVSLNHRLNALAYLYLGDLHPDFTDSGNSGQLDIVLALQWVRDNITAFGGDPDNVTLFGQSGGGAKVSALLGTVPAKGLFHKAIAQSGATPMLVERADAAAIAEQTLAKLGVARADVHQLQTMDVRKVIAAASAVKLPGGAGLSSRTLAPVVDGRSVPAHPFLPKASALSRDVPLMIGTTKDEATLFLAMDPAFGKMSADDARTRFNAMLGPRGEAAFDVYRSAQPDDPPTYWVTSLMTDMMLRTNAIIEADRKAEQNAAPVYMYRVDYEPRVADRALRSPHGAEVPLMFGNFIPPEFIGSGPELAALSKQTMQSWINFAHSGDPSRKGLVWPRYDTRQRQTVIIDVPMRVAADPNRPTREFWAA